MSLSEQMDYLVEHGICTEAEVELVIDINGYSEETMHDILFARTGYRSFEQLENADE